MIIAFDLRCFLTSEGRGIGNYTIALVNSMISEHPEYFFSFLNWSDKSIVDYFDISESVSVNEMHAENAIDENVVHETIERFLKLYKPDVFWITIPVVKGFPTYSKKWFSNTFLVATVHDLIEYIYKDYYFSDFESYRTYINELYKLRKYDLIFSNSECTRNDYIKHLGIKEERVLNIYMDGFDAYRGGVAGDKEIQTDFDYYLCVSGNPANKNALRLVKAFAGTADRLKGKKLIITGLTGQTKDAAERIAKSYGNEDKIIIKGRVSNSELYNLYQNALWLIIPSIYEGFGMPILEAWRSGVPVVASKDSSVGEVVKDAGVLFDPKDISKIENALVETSLMNTADRNEFIKRGKQRSEDFSWKKTVNRACVFLQDLVKRKQDITDDGLDEAVIEDCDRDVLVWDANDIVKKKNDEICLLWDGAVNRGDRIARYLESNNIHKIALYGLGFWGNRLLNELYGKNIKISYIIDKRADYLEDYVPVIKPKSKYDSVDAVIITPWERADSIIREFNKSKGLNIITMDNVISDALR